MREFVETLRLMATKQKPGIKRETIHLWAFIHEKNAGKESVQKKGAAGREGGGGLRKANAEEKIKGRKVWRKMSEMEKGQSERCLSGEQKERVNNTSS